MKSTIYLSTETSTSNSNMTRKTSEAARKVGSCSDAVITDYQLSQQYKLNCLIPDALSSVNKITGVISVYRSRYNFAIVITDWFQSHSIINCTVQSMVGWLVGWGLTAF